MSDDANLAIARAVLSDRKCVHLRAFMDMYMDSPVVLLDLDFSAPDDVVGACIVCDLPLMVRDLDPTKETDVSDN